LGCSIELAFRKIVSSNHCQHMPAAHIHSQERTLDQRVLLQGEGVQFPRRIDLGHTYLNDITTPEELTTYLSTQLWVHLPDPGIPRGRNHPTRIFNGHCWPRIPDGQHHA